MRLRAIAIVVLIGVALGAQVVAQDAKPDPPAPSVFVTGNGVKKPGEYP